MSDTVALRRGAKPRAAPPRAKRPAVNVSRKAAPKTIKLPISEKTLGRLLWGGGGAIVVLGLVTLVWTLGIPQALWEKTAQAIGRAGFRIEHVEVEGASHMAKLPIYAAALDRPSTAMPLVDLNDIRDRLLRYPWVEDATVSRRLPDTLVISIVERRPSAIWQNRGKLALIDATGVPLQAVEPGALPSLPLLVGDGANIHASALMQLLDEAPALKADLIDATWIGGRRWDLHFRSGEELALPEGEEQARNALRLFARLDATTGLLKRGFARFDMRLPDKMTVRVSREPGKAVAPPETKSGNPV